MTLLFEVLRILVSIIELSILFRIILSFLNIREAGILPKLINEITEPVLSPARELLGKLGLDRGMFDFSPILAIFFLRLLLMIAAEILLK